MDGPSLLVQSLLYAVLLQGVVGPLSPVLVVAVMSRFRASPEGRAGGLLVLSFIQREREIERAEKCLAQLLWVMSDGGLHTLERVAVGL